MKSTFLFRTANTALSSASTLPLHIDIRAVVLPRLEWGTHEQKLEGGRVERATKNAKIQQDNLSN